MIKVTENVVGLFITLSSELHFSKMVYIYILYKLFKINPERNC